MGQAAGASAGSVRPPLLVAGRVPRRCRARAAVRREVRCGRRPIASAGVAPPQRVEDRAGAPRRSGARSTPGTASVMYVREYGSSVRHTRCRVGLPDRSTTRPWNAASAAASACASPASAAARIAAIRSVELVEVRVRDARDGEPDAPSDSSSARMTNASRSSAVVGRRTRAPRNAVRLHDPQGLEVAQRLADGRLARPELPGDPGLDDPGARRVAAVEDRLEEVILDLRRSGRCARSRPWGPWRVVPATRRRPRGPAPASRPR